MREILRQNNTDLLREIEQLAPVLQSVAGEIPPELDTYYAWVVRVRDAFYNQAIQNLQDLDLDREDTLPDILSVTQELTRGFSLFNQYWVSPVLRFRPLDRLSLKILRWLHASNPTTQHIPVALRDGGVSILPVPDRPTIYYMPSSAQQGLLYLPLFFHEKGHLLYACHKPEMDDRVQELQETIAELLEPKVQRNDHPSEEDARRRSIIVEKWYEWTQEVFCDAVGFIIGGPAYLHAFSMFLRMRGKDQFHLPPSDLEKQEHPITWLRIRILADRACREGFEKEAEQITAGWDQIAGAMEISEDYYGFFEDGFLPEIQQTIDDMVEESSPRKFESDETLDSEKDVAFQSPVHLLNRAWHQFWKDPAGYGTWERNAIKNYLEEPGSGPV